MDADFGGLQWSEVKQILAKMAMTDDELQAVDLAWCLAKHALQQQTQMVGDAFQPAKCLKPDELVPAPAIVKKGIYAATSLEPGTSVQSWKELVPAAGKSASRLEFLLLQLYAIVLTVGKHSLQPSQAVLDDPQAAMHGYLLKFKKMGENTLAAKLSVLKRWALY